MEIEKSKLYVRDTSSSSKLGLRKSRLHRYAPTFILLPILLISTLTWSLFNSQFSWPEEYFTRPINSDQSINQDRVQCLSVRGYPLYDHLDDQLKPRVFDDGYPRPLSGSYEALNLEKTWMSAAERYGPYGYGEETPEYNRSKVDWEKIDWGDIQNECFALNSHRFGDTRNITSERRMSLFQPNVEKILPRKDPFEKTGRTAIIFRVWDKYKYTEKDLHHLRAVVTETSLGSQGDYTVVLLVHTKNKEEGIFESEENYQRILKAVVPLELRSITILFDNNLLESWYPKVGEYSAEYQMFQATQLFAHFYPEFDYYWHLEMDIRYTGNTLTYLESLSTFARSTPRKQSFERAQYVYIPEVHGTYNDFMHSVNSSLNGTSIWGPMEIPDITPIGPTPPVINPQDDNFTWGIGEEADVVTTGFCMNVTQSIDWIYRDWIQGVAGLSTPRLSCPPAIARASRPLLMAIHDAQHVSGVRVPSEATLASFALWHGLKLSHPPSPWFQDPPRDATSMNIFFNGGEIRRGGGMPWGVGVYDAVGHYAVTNTATWWWGSELPMRIMADWFGEARENSWLESGYDEVTGYGGVKGYGELKKSNSKLKKGYGELKSVYGEAKGYEKAQSYGGIQSYGQRKGYGRGQSYGSVQGYGEVKGYGMIQIYGEESLVYLLREEDGEIFAPVLGLHPVKTNRNP